MLVLRFNNWFYSTKTLKTFFWLRWIATVAFGAAFLLGFGLNLAYLMALSGCFLISSTAIFKASATLFFFSSVTTLSGLSRVARAC